jgi:hypothetical protein
MNGEVNLQAQFRITKKALSNQLLTTVWLKMVPWAQSILNAKQIRELEAFRKQFEIPDDFFSRCVIASSERRKIVIRRDYKEFKETFSDLSEREILMCLLEYETQTMHMTEEQIAHAMSKIESLDDLCDFVVSREQREQPVHDNEICKEIDSIIRTFLHP